MTVVVTHSTPSDASFSATGATAWNATHTLSGVGTMAGQDANAVAITGGSIDSTTVGATTASTGAFTTLSASSTVSGTGFSTYLASPPAIGGTAAAAGTFTTLTSPTLKSLTGSVTTGISLETPLGAQATIIDIGDGTRPLRLNGGSAAGAQSAGISAATGVLQLSTNTSTIGFYTGGRGSTSQLQVSHTASAVNYVQVTGATTASKVVAISAQGSDTDVTLSLSPKGAGTIRFGTYTGTILTPTGYITITDSGGTSRRLLVG